MQKVDLKSMTFAELQQFVERRNFAQRSYISGCIKKWSKNLRV